MKDLSLYNLESIDNITYPEHYQQITIDSPASHIFTDFKYTNPLIIDVDTLASDALKLMIKAHVQMKIVVSDNKDFLGIISTKELSERHIITEIAKGLHREEISVGDMMLRRDSLQAFDYQSIEKATVKDVINALKTNGLSHCLVLDRENHEIRGVISASDITRKLHLPIEINTKTSFSELFQVIHG